MPILRRPLSAADKKILEAKTKPSSEDILKAQDDLFLNLALRVNALETEPSNEDILKAQDKLLLSLALRINELEMKAGGKS